MGKCLCPLSIPLRLIVPDHSPPTCKHVVESGQELSPIHGQGAEAKSIKDRN